MTWLLCVFPRLTHIACFTRLASDPLYVTQRYACWQRGSRTPHSKEYHCVTNRTGLDVDKKKTGSNVLVFPSVLLLLLLLVLPTSAQTLLRRCELNIEPTWMTLQVDNSKHDKMGHKMMFHSSFKMFISSFGQFLRFRWQWGGGGGGGGGLQGKKVRDACQKIWIKLNRMETINVTQASFDH